jgi:hypothetical protein
MTPKEKQQNFYKELKKLLLKYNANILIDHKSRLNWGGHKMLIEFGYDQSLFDECGNGYIPKLDLGSYENGKKIFEQE